MGKCKRCGAEPEGEYGLHDYCATCSRNLCEKCMKLGCCGHTPAQSGADVDCEATERMRAAKRARK